MKAPTAERSLDDKSTTLGFRHLSCIATLDARADADADAVQQARSNKQEAYVDSNLRHLTGLAISLPAVPSHRDQQQPTDFNFSIPPRSKEREPCRIIPTLGLGSRIADTYRHRGPLPTRRLPASQRCYAAGTEYVHCLWIPYRHGGQAGSGFKHYPQNNAPRQPFCILHRTAPLQSPHQNSVSPFCPPPVVAPCSSDLLSARQTVAISIRSYMPSLRLSAA